VVLHQVNLLIKAKVPVKKNKEVCLVLAVLMEVIAIEGMIIILISFFLTKNSHRERGKKYRNDEKFESSKSHQQYSRGGYQKPRDRGDSRSRSRSPSDRRFGHDKKKTIIFKPTLEGHLYSFRQFMEAQKFEIDPSKAEKIYQKYKSEYEDKQNQIFFAEHRVFLFLFKIN